MNDAANRSLDDEAPITAGDVAAARQLLRWVRVLRVATAVVFAPIVVLAMILLQHAWTQHCIHVMMEAHIANRHAALLADPPADTVVHRGNEGTILELGTWCVLVRDGQVAATTLHAR